MCDSLLYISKAERHSSATEDVVTVFFKICVTYTITKFVKSNTGQDVYFPMEKSPLHFLKIKTRVEEQTAHKI